MYAYPCKKNGALLYWQSKFQNFKVPKSNIITCVPLQNGYQNFHYDVYNNIKEMKNFYHPFFFFITKKIKAYKNMAIYYP